MYLPVESIRYGRACNSSSSHSIIIVKDKDLNKIEDTYHTEGLNFGWEFFTLKSELDKARYLVAQVWSQYRHKNGEVTVDDLIQAIFVDYPELIQDLLSIETDEYTYGVDHQSVWAIPASPEWPYSNIEFLQDLWGWLKSPNIIVLGGNDNTDHVHPAERYGDRVFYIPTDRGTPDLLRVIKQGPGLWSYFMTSTYSLPVKLLINFNKDNPNEKT